MADAKPRRNADLPARVASAVVMVAIAGGALWLGGWGWALFVSAVGLGVMWEWWGLARAIAKTAPARLAWLLGGAIYIGLAIVMLVRLRGESAIGWPLLLIVLLGVILTDVGAYFTGRTFGGPKIAPAISPSKTWSGLLGGALGVFGHAVVGHGGVRERDLGLRGAVGGRVRDEFDLILGVGLEVLLR